MHIKPATTSKQIKSLAHIIRVIACVYQSTLAPQLYDFIYGEL